MTKGVFLRVVQFGVIFLLFSVLVDTGELGLSA